MTPPLSPGRVVAGIRRRTSWWGGRRGRNFVLLYHRISTVPTCDPLRLEVTADRFRRQLEHLADRYEIVRADQCHVVGARPRIAITLDDGYADNAEVAAPILSRLGVPATFFVTTDALEDGVSEFWWDRLEHLLCDGDDQPEEFTIKVDRRAVLVSFVDRRRRLETLARLNRLLIRRDPATVERVLSELVSRTGRQPAPCTRHRRMSATEVKALASDDLFEIGSHTCSHPSLRSLPSGDVRCQLVESRRILGDVLGETPRLLAYPFGSPPAVRRRTTVEAKGAGYEMAFLNIQGAADAASPFSLPRISVDDREPEQLVEVLTRWNK